MKAEDFLQKEFGLLLTQLKEAKTKIEKLHIHTKLNFVLDLLMKTLED